MGKAASIRNSANPAARRTWTLDGAIRMIFEQSDGSIWVATANQLVRFRNGQMAVFGTDQGLAADVLTAIADRSGGGFWVGTRRGIQEFRDGRFLPCDFGSQNYPSRDAQSANGFYAGLEGRTVNQVRATVVEALRESGELVGDVRPITHPVKFYERGERPLEIVTSRQWFVSTLARRDELLQRGEQLHWHPDFMKHRYKSWVEGLNVDWNISRQRFFGVPFPVWYPTDANAEIDFDSPLLPEPAELPVDPSSDVPRGFVEAQRNQPDGFVGDPDVMDTWATSSLSPQIAGHWGTEMFDHIFPMDLRPQAHEIIRTWLFSTVLRSRPPALRVAVWSHS